MINYELRITNYNAEFLRREKLKGKVLFNRTFSILTLIYADRRRSMNESLVFLRAERDFEDGFRVGVEFHRPFELVCQ